MKFAVISVLAITCTAFIYRLPKTGNNPVPYPSGYRNWVHIKTAINSPSEPTHSGFHHIYANEKAAAGYRTGNFADGAIIVFDVLESLQQTNGDMLEGKRKLVDVMVKDSEKYKDTGGWGFGEFAGDDKTEEKMKETAKPRCFNCHSGAKETGFVFSKYRE